MFEIDSIISQIGESVTITDIPASTSNDYGDETEEGIPHTGSTAVVQIMDASDTLVEEGILEPEDIMAFFKDDDANASYLKSGNKITYGSTVYEMVNVIRNNGHYEIHAKKESVS